MRLSLSMLILLMACINARASEEKSAAAKEIPKPAKLADIPNPAQLVDGKKLFEVNCSACHGPTGRGDGAAAAALNPKPRNLSDAQYMSKRPVPILRQIIVEGGQSAGLSPLMIGWKASLKPEQIDAVLQYVLSLSQPKLAEKKKKKIGG